MLEDPLFWVLVLPGLLLGTYAQWRIKANVAEYSQVRTDSGMTGAEVARRLLDSRGLQDVTIEATPGILTDHYDPRTKILRLSQDVYYTPSLAAAGIAAHEAGHAIQDADDYFPMEARTYIVPIVQLASKIAPWLFVAGGCLGAVYVTSSVLLTPRIGAASLVAFLVTGQLLASVIVDRAGYFGVAVRELSMGRIVGAMLLLAGALMIRIY